VPLPRLVPGLSGGGWHSHESARKSSGSGRRGGAGSGTARPHRHPCAPQGTPPGQQPGSPGFGCARRRPTRPARIRVAQRQTPGGAHPVRLPARRSPDRLDRSALWRARHGDQRGPPGGFAPRARPRCRRRLWRRPFLGAAWFCLLSVLNDDNVGPRHDRACAIVAKWPNGHAAILVQRNDCLGNAVADVSTNHGNFAIGPAHDDVAMAVVCVRVRRGVCSSSAFS
jgi:hypothetical protein